VTHLEAYFAAVEVHGPTFFASLQGRDLSDLTPEDRRLLLRARDGANIGFLRADELMMRLGEHPITLPPEVWRDRRRPRAPAAVEAQGVLF
jgi:hypothetical protein